MKNTVLFFSFALLILAASSFSSNTAFAAYCPGQTTNPLSYICLDRSLFPRNKPITFTIYQSRIPLFIGTAEHPWYITDESGNIIFTPSSLAPTTQPSPVFSWSDTWDLRNNEGKKVKKGDYYIHFRSMPYNVAPVLLTIG